MVSKKYLSVFVFLFLLLIPLSGFSKDNRGIDIVSSGRSSSTGWGNYHALIIGINAYQEWNPLQTAVKDATALRDLLVKRYGFLEKNVILRTDHDATEWRIASDLRRMATRLDESDNLLIYFAGHGQLDEITGGGYWIPVEGKLKNASTWISQDYIKRILTSERVRGKNIVVVADSCYSGSILRGGPSLLAIDDYRYQQKLVKAAARRSRQVITSGGVEPVADGGRDGHSLFAYYFIKALKENTREAIDLENLFHTRVWKYVTEIGDQRPNVGRFKTPMDDDGQFVLIDKEAIAQKRLAEQRRQQAQRIKMEQERRQYQHSQQLLALQAEKEKLEAQRLLLEAQKELIAEKRRLEAERSKLDSEKLKQQPERPQPKKLAYVPRPSMPSQPGSRIKLAILPWQFEIIDNFNFADDLFRYPIREAACDAIDAARQYDLDYSFYHLEKKSDTQKISSEILTKDLKKKLWTRKSFFASLEPNTKLMAEIGRQLKVDAVLVYDILIQRGPKPVEVYLVDVHNNQVFSSTGSARYFLQDEGYDIIYKITKTVLGEYIKGNYKEAAALN